MRNEIEIIAAIVSSQGKSPALIEKNYLQLYKLNYRKVYGFMLNYLNWVSKEGIDEIVNSSFETAFRKLNQFDSKKGKFSSWVIEIAKNKTIDYQKRESRTKNLFDLDVDELRIVIADGCYKETYYLDQFKKYLSDFEVELLQLKYINCLKYDEIAVIVNKTQTACRTHVSRCLSRLRDTIDYRYCA